MILNRSLTNIQMANVARYNPRSIWRIYTNLRYFDTIKWAGRITRRITKERNVDLRDFYP